MIIERGTGHPDASLPLAGVRVLDLTDEAVVLAPRLLADLGAEVVRVESSAGDDVRRRGPFLDGRPGIERSLAHLLYNAGKQSAALALDTSPAWDLIDRLAAAVHAIVAPLEKPPHARRFFDESRLRMVHPSVGVVDTVLRRDAPGAAVTDLIGVAAGGLLYLNGFQDDPPNMPAGKLAYKQASLAASLAAMSLIMTERRFGRAGRITVSMQEAVMQTTLQTANENYWHWHRTCPGRAGWRALGSRTTYQSADDLWVSFSVPPNYWDAYTAWVAEATGRDEFQQPHWQDPRYRIEHVAETIEATVALCATLPRERLVGEGQRRHLLVLPVNDVAGIAADAHLQARGFFAPVWHPRLGRDLLMPMSPFLSSAYEAPVTPAPALGQHTETVLRRLAGVTDAELAALIESRTIAVSDASEEAIHG